MKSDRKNSYTRRTHCYIIIIIIIVTTMHLKFSKLYPYDMGPLTRRFRFAVANTVSNILQQFDKS